MSARQQVLMLWLASPSLEAHVLGWSFFDGTSGAGPQLAADPPYATGVAALVDGWRLLQMSPLNPPLPGHERETSFLKHEFVFERLVEPSLSTRLLRHVVLFRFNDGTPTEKVDEIAAAFADLPAQIDVVVDLEWGTNNSPEGLANGFTHCFFVSFADEEGRAVYLPHAAHQRFVELLRPHLDTAFVFDYWPR